MSKKNTEFTLNNITLEDIKHASNWGGAMYNEGTLILDNVTFNNNIAKTSKAVGGGAGNVDLASVKMEHGYIQYGLGVTKTWKDRLNSFFQIVFRNGGRTGVDFQLGLNYTFDWFSPKSNKTPKANASQIKKTQKVKEFQHIGSKTVLKSLSMK